MAVGDSWQAWRAVEQARQQLDRHLGQCPDCRSWQGKRKLWIHAGGLTSLPLCDQGTSLAQAWTGQLRRARALRSGSAPKQR